MSLLQEIEDGASGDAMPLGTLLRKCLVLASRLGSQPAIDWIKWELDGYPEDVEVPDYRVIFLVIKANMIDFVRRAEGWPVPPALLGEHAQNWTRFRNRDGIGAIEQTLTTSEGTISLVMGNLSLFLKSREFTEMEIISAWGEASTSQYKHILDSVRTRVLMFALDLGREFPDAGAVKSTVPKDAERVTQIFTNNIYGPANVVGTASHSNVVLNVMKDDFASLKQTLEEHGVSEADIKELKGAVDAETKPTAKGFGPRVADWVGKMMKKAADGSWSIGSSAAGGLLSRVLSKYYGLP